MKTAALPTAIAKAHRNPEHEPVSDLKLSFAKLASTQSARAAQSSRPVAAPAAARQQQESRRLLYPKACDYLTQVFQMVRSRKAFSLEAGAAIVREMVDGATDSDELFIAALHLDDRTRFAIRHSVNVAVYAVHMARDLGFDRERQVQIGLAGLLHDVGMALIPESTIYKQGALSAEEVKSLRERPNQALKILQGLGPDAAALAETAGQVYERLDGSGYPRGLASDEIHEFAKIIGLLDLYEALVHSRPNRRRLSFFEAVKYICKSCKTQFDRGYMKSLLRVFTVFPRHSCVQLNSEAIGRVIDIHPDQPMRPKLTILMDSQRRKTLVERIVDLPQEPLLNIVRSVSEKEIKEIMQGQGQATARVEPEAGCDTVKEPIM
jgi:HD-GYP domain-containing protein (c-di-GMP phosphodiesterase class II)